MKIRCAYDKLVPLEDLNPNPKNRNKHPESQVKHLARIFKAQGIRKPIIVSNRSGLMTIGHGRLLAAKLLKMKTYPVNFQDYDDEGQEYADMVADNAVALQAEIDTAGVNADVVDLGPDFNVDLLGIPGFTVDASGNGPQTDQDAVPPPPKKAKTRPGDLYRLGDHRLICGDSTRPEALSRLMAGDQADMVWTDPPYNVAYVGKTKESLTIENDSMGDQAFFEFLSGVYRALLSVTKPGGSIYIAHADSEGANFRQAMKAEGWLLKQCLIWVKQTLVMGRQDYHWKHEPILYGWAPGAAHNWFTDRKQTTVLEFDRPSRSTDHPTMKPVDLVAYCIGNSSAPGQLVLDSFGGSGTTMIACEKLKRKARLCELDPIYVDVIIRRWEEFTGKKAELIAATTIKKKKTKTSRP